MSSDSDNTFWIRHHTHKRKKVVISDSGSIDESVIVQTRRKKKIFRVVSEGESIIDDSDVPKPVIRRQNHRVISEDESNYNSSAEGSKFIESNSSSTSSECGKVTGLVLTNEDTKKYTTKRKVLSKIKSENAEKPGSSSSTNANVNSDSSDDQSKKCPICFLPFRKQQVGTPSVCDHYFCLECLVEWSKNNNICPVDRIPFTLIDVREHFDGKVINQLPVETVPRIENQVVDDPTFCEICHQSDREDRMLLCNNCDRSYHMECLTPPMTTVAIEELFCPGCTRNNSTRSRVISEYESNYNSSAEGSKFIENDNRSTSPEWQSDGTSSDESEEDPIPEKSVLEIDRYNAGIPQVSLFGDNLGLDYSPPRSDDDGEYSIGTGSPPISISQRRSAVLSHRSRAILKSIVDPVNEVDNTDTDLLSSIMHDQEILHSTKKGYVIVKADGTLMVNNPEKENKHSINNNESPKKEKQDQEEVTRREETILEEVDTPLDLSNINSNDITQAPMYNNPCGGSGGSGGGSGNRGNFRG